MGELGAKETRPVVLVTEQHIAAARQVAEELGFFSDIRIVGRMNQSELRLSCEEVKRRKGALVVIGMISPELSTAVAEEVARTGIPDIQFSSLQVMRDYYCHF